jgi:hypothetical protein
MPAKHTPIPLDVVLMLFQEAKAFAGLGLRALLVRLALDRIPK